MLSSCLGGALLVLICGAVLVIGGATLVGRRVSSVFTQLNSGLANPNGLLLPTAGPIDTSAAVAVGTLVRVGGLELVVNSSATQSGDESAQPTAGNTFLSVDLKVTNRGPQTNALHSTLVLARIQDDRERTFNCCVFGLMNGLGDMSELESGASTSLTLVYEVPEDSDTLFWVYQPILSDGPPAIVRLR